MVILGEMSVFLGARYPCTVEVAVAFVVPHGKHKRPHSGVDLILEFSIILRRYLAHRKQRPPRILQ